MRQVTGRPFLGVIFAHQLNSTIGQCVEDLELITGASELEEWSSRVVFVPLR
jgi:hypothetical protein